MSIKDEISKNILFYRKKNNLTQKELADKLGVKHNAVSSWENGKNSVDTEVLFSICDILNVSLDEMYGVTPNKITVTGHRNLIEKYSALDEHGKEVVDNLINAEIKRIEQEKNKSKVKKLIAKMSVITYDLPASAGTGAFLDGDDCEHVEYPVDDVPYGTDFAVKIQGDSMEPDYMDGGVAFVRKQSEINDGNIGIFVLNGEGYIKQIEYRKGTAYLVSLNPAYKDIKVLDTDNFRCSGKVLN